MTIERKLLGTTPVSGEVLPEAVSFDGTNDYLSRSSDMTGNSDGKTFTFSCWFYGATGGTIYHSGGAGYTDGVSIGFEQSGELNIKMDNPSGSTVFSVEHGGAIAMNTWNHLLISCDMSSTSNRHIYVNDVALGNSYLTYTDSDIDFTSSTHSIVQLNKLKGRLAHLFLDYTYRDLSVTSNRRLFIDAEGKPSDTIPSSPILYLPMTDAATAGSNSGTGGDFTVNGVLATAERGPNQDNCSASTFDGSNDYMTRASIGASNSKVFTVSGTINFTSGDGFICRFYKNGHGVLFNIATNIYGSLYIKAYNASYQNRFYVQWKNSIGANNALMPNHNYHFSLSVDMSDTSKRHLIINGAAVSPTYTYYTDVEMGFSAIDLSRVGFVSGEGYFAGDLGELYFNTTYTDLSTDNPFWDSDANRPNSVRKVIADTSVTPLVALPLMGNDAGNNLGSGGDFNVVSGPFTGARGGSEYWSRTVNFNGHNNGNGLTRSGLSGSSNTYNISAVMIFKHPDTQTKKLLSLAYSSSSNSKNRFTIEYSSTLFKVIAQDTSGNWGPSITGPTDSGTGQPIITSVSTNTWHTVFFSIKTNGTSYCIFDGTQYSTFEGSGGNIGLGQANLCGINRGAENGSYDDDRKQDIAFLYLDDSYIDFSQEANRNKFINQLGYPRDLTQQIEDEDIPNPLLYMKFDAAALGTNSGTGGNFTVNGTVTSGADFTP